MKEFRLETFNNLADASMWLEQELYDLEVIHDDIRGEITLIDGNWRVGVIVNSRQGEIDFGTEV
jgi:hypothetical protein